MSNWESDCRWWLTARAPISISVLDESAETKTRRAEAIKSGARVVPFGFGRVLAPDPVVVDPVVWEGDDG